MTTRTPRFVPLPKLPWADHNPAVTAAFKARGFRPVGTGGNQVAYAKRKGRGEINVISVGDGLPLAMGERVEVYEFGPGMEPLAERVYASASAYLRTVRAPAKRKAAPKAPARKRATRR